MATTGGNARWRALSDECPPEPDGPLDELWSLLTVAQQQAVASGRIDLEGLLDAITSSSDLELCPRCASDYVPASSQLGLCRACARRAANEALEAMLAAVDAQREADMLKQRIHRAREAAGVPLPRSGRTTGAR